MTCSSLAEATVFEVDDAVNAGALPLHTVGGVHVAVLLLGAHDVLRLADEQVFFGGGSGCLHHRRIAARRGLEQGVKHELTATHARGPLKSLLRLDLMNDPIPRHDPREGRMSCGEREDRKSTRL